MTWTTERSKKSRAVLTAEVDALYDAYVDCRTRGDHIGMRWAQDKIHGWVLENYTVDDLLPKLPASPAVVREEEMPDDSIRTVHHWFELSYAQYLTVPRSVLQSMDTEWQARFVACLNELDDTLDWRPSKGRYWVRLKDAAGRYVHDPLMEYRHSPRMPRSDGKPWTTSTDLFIESPASQDTPPSPGA